MTQTESDNKRLRMKVLALQERLDELESLLLGVLAVSTVVLLSLGTVQTAIVDPHGELGDLRLILVPLQLTTLLDNADNVPLVLVLILMAALVVLSVMTAAVIAIGMLGRESTNRTLILAKIVNAVLVAGVAAMVVFALVATGIDDEEIYAGPAVWWFTPGVGLFAALVWHPLAQRLWCTDR